MNNATISDTDDDGSFDNSGRSIGNFAYGLGLSLGILLIFLILAYISYMCKRKINSNNYNEHSVRRSIDTSTTTDEEFTIKSYPEFEYSRMRPHKDESTASGCSICLADYKDSDSLRLLPDCGHIFHAKCIDPWLSMNPTCPICRNSPVPKTPLVVVLENLRGGVDDC